MDSSATGDDNGSSWTDAYNSLQDALTDARVSPKPVEVRVAAGTYKPDRRAGQSTWDAEATFQLISGVRLLGGFAGRASEDPESRDIATYRTILSGDLRWTDTSYGCYHVVTGSGTDSTAVLDGFVIEDGYAAGYGLDACGAGLLNVGGSPTITHCVFSANQAFNAGGAVYNEGGSPYLENCLFEGNQASHGGAVANGRESQVYYSGCTFAGNAAVDGGAVANERCQSRFNGCVFTRNKSSSLEVFHGGGSALFNMMSDAILEHCLIVGNAAEPGGTILSVESSNLYRASTCMLRNCTVAGNQAPYPSFGLDFDGVVAPTRVDAVNCIIKDNMGAVWRSFAVSSAVTYSCIGPTVGVGNISVDPRFARPGYWDPNGTPDDPNDDVWVDGDYHLKSQAGRWDSNSENWVTDSVTSPCIDAGDPNSPIGLEPFPNGGRINMGAYGGTAEASKSLSADPNPPTTDALLTRRRLEHGTSQ